jgi:hypothetical protein
MTRNSPTYYYSAQSNCDQKFQPPLVATRIVIRQDTHIGRTGPFIRDEEDVACPTTQRINRFPSVLCIVRENVPIIATTSPKMMNGARRDTRCDAQALVIVVRNASAYC